MAGQAAPAGEQQRRYARARDPWRPAGRFLQVVMGLGVLGMYADSWALLVASPIAVGTLVLAGLRLWRPGAVEADHDGVAHVYRDLRAVRRTTWAWERCGPFQASDDQRSVRFTYEDGEVSEDLPGPWVGVSASELAVRLNGWRTEALGREAPTSK